jgi:hypothetical protein
MPATKQVTDVERKKDLKQIVQSVIVGQGNEFIKELLRGNGIKIGVTKADFVKNLNTAIDEDKLTLSIIEEWLNEVEGWGSQHIYLYGPLKLSLENAREKVLASKYARLFNRPSSYEFPAELALTSITIGDDLLSLTWHIGNSEWVRASGKDYQEEEDGDLYEYRAYRHFSDRSVVRFEWHITNPYCAIFLPQANKEKVHEDILRKVWLVLRETDLCKNELGKISINNAVNALRVNSRQATTTSVTLRVDGGHVNLVSDLPEGGIEDVEAVREVGRAVNPTKFKSSEGMFKLDTDANSTLSRPIKLQIFGIESRIRVWVKCKREDIYNVIRLIWSSN